MSTPDSTGPVGLRNRAIAAKTAREALLLSQDQLAGAAGVSVSTIARLERGNQVSTESLKAVCAVLHLDARTLHVAPASKVSRPAFEPAPADSLPVPDITISPGAPPLPRPNPAWRLSRRLAALCLLATASHVLALVAQDVAAQTSRMELAPHRNAFQGNLLGVAILVGAREVNRASARYSTALPADAPEREWEPWQTGKPATWLACGPVSLLGDGIVRLAGLAPESEAHCRERGVPQRLSRRDEERTDFLVGPLARNELEAFAGHLTGDPTIRIRAAVTPLGDVPPDGPAWFDPRLQGSRPTAGPQPGQYLHLRISRES